MTRIGSTVVRDALPSDSSEIRRIYNQGIEDRIATLDEEPKSFEDIETWFREHDERFRVLVAERNGGVDIAARIAALRICRSISSEANAGRASERSCCTQSSDVR